MSWRPRLGRSGGSGRRRRPTSQQRQRLLARYHKGQFAQKECKRVKAGGMVGMAQRGLGPPRRRRRRNNVPYLAVHGASVISKGGERLPAVARIDLFHPIQADLAGLS